MRFVFIKSTKKDKNKGIRISVVSWELFKMIYHMERIKCSGFTFNKSQVEMSLSAFSYNNLFSLLYPFSSVFNKDCTRGNFINYFFVAIKKIILKPLSLGFLFIKNYALDF